MEMKMQQKKMQISKLLAAAQRATSGLKFLR